MASSVTLQDLTGSRFNVVAAAILLASLAVGLVWTITIRNPIPVIGMALVGLIGMLSPCIAQQWERAIVLRLGRFHAMRGPGLFWIVPFFDSITSWIDQRTITTGFAA